MTFASRIGPMVPSDPAPLYVQFARLLREAIAGGVLEEGAALPAERDLAIEFGISRITIRKAMAELVEEGLLVRRRGAGTTVSRRIEKSFARISSFSEDMIARGRSPSSSWISRAAGLVMPEEAMQLGLSPGAPVLRFHRVRHADEIPMALEFSTIPGWCLPGIEDVTDSLYTALDATGHRPTRALQRLRAVPVLGNHARLLGIDPGSPGLLIERCGFLRDGRAVEFTQSFYRGDAYDFVAELTDL
ncbi:GntR family transcriptional regulator [Sphingomonas sp. GC_Shp_6]|uniref:GntR family transcriptional regulator n=1 Tax=Sphingomonas sp. GC_Shp_6 TaxID=2937378 RepID=UPI00226A9DA8